MGRDEERIKRVQHALAGSGMDATVCALPSNVLLLSGYWPVIGTSIAIATREGAIGLAVPEDEYELAQQSWSGEFRTFQGGSLDTLQSIPHIVCGPLSELGAALGFRPGMSIGIEGSASFEPSSYASMFIYGAAIQTLLREAFPSAQYIDCSEPLSQLRSVLTQRELGLVRRTCKHACDAFLETASQISSGMREFEIAALLRAKLTSNTTKTERRQGFAYCMSGPNSAKAFAAYQQSGRRAIAAGDFVLVHCNSNCGGFWTDITRTFRLGNADAEKDRIAAAVLEASSAAIEAVRPGVAASAVDRAARHVLENHGYGKAFKHATGHGVGFAAINHDALPRIHPLSDGILEPGMVFNIEPAVYLEGYGGMRHCSMVAVTGDGAELLTDCQSRREDLALLA